LNVAEGGGGGGRGAPGGLAQLNFSGESLGRLLRLLILLVSSFAIQGFLANFLSSLFPFLLQFNNIGASSL